jgi:hypothetical protein
MSCHRIQNELSAYMDGDLSSAERDGVTVHLATCASCARHLRELREVSCALSCMPKMECPEPLAARVLDRLEVESRGPGLALLFRSALGARPFIVPSLLPAALVVMCTLSFILMLGNHDMRAVAQGGVFIGPSGSDANPSSPTEDVMAKAQDDNIFLDVQLLAMREQTIFVETGVARDGRVSWVRLLEGDQKTAAPILKELRLERCVPGRDEEGRPVAMRSFRLISAMEVRAPRT